MTGVAKTAYCRRPAGEGGGRWSHVSSFEAGGQRDLT